MAYRLDLSQTLPDALRAVIDEQLEDAVHQLRERLAEDPVSAVHETRKDLKKARSALRLARVGLSPKRRRKLNGRMRDVAAELSDVRDADVMAATVGALGDRYAGQVPKRMFTTVRTRFAKAALAARENVVVADELLDELEAIRADVAQLPVAATPKMLAKGARIAYERGCVLFAEARERPSTESLHEWRKRVKDLWYHTRLLEETWPGLLGAYEQEAHRLSEHLGDEHDLGVLAERLADGDWPPSVDVEVLLALVDRRREELREQAWALGNRLYAEAPKAYYRRVRRYLSAG